MYVMSARSCRGCASILAAALLAGGCVVAPLRFDNSVSSLARSDAGSRRSYLLLPGQKEVGEGDLQFLEFAGYVELLLADAGFRRVASIGEADIVLFLVYGIGSPKEHVYSSSLPTWGQTGISSAQTFGTVSTYGGVGTYSGTTTYTPRYGVTGYSTHVGTYPSYTRFMRLDAYDAVAARESKALEQVWSTTTASTGRSGDLRLVFPYMVAATRGRLAQSSSQSVYVAVWENDPFVGWLRQQPAQGVPER